MYTSRLSVIDAANCIKHLWSAFFLSESENADGCHSGAESRHGPSGVFSQRMPFSSERTGRWGATEALIAGVAAIVTALVAFALVNRKPTASRSPVTVRDTVHHRPIAGGEFEISGVAHVPGTNGILVLDDDTTNEIFLVEVGRDTTQAGDAIPVALGADVTDMEGITFDGTYYYVVGSQSKPTGFEGAGLVRFRYDPATRRVNNTETIGRLKEWLADNVAELKGTAQKIGDHVLNIEALAWDPISKRLLLGLRAPVVDGHALIVPVRLVDPAGSFSRDNIRADGPAIRVDLGGDGIRSLEYDPESNRYRLITGATLNEETRDFRIVEWDGRDRTSVRDIALYSRKLKPEGIANAELYGKRTKVIVFDIGTFLLATD